jgi:hypothetical protein
LIDEQHEPEAENGGEIGMSYDRCCHSFPAHRKFLDHRLSKKGDKESDIDTGTSKGPVPIFVTPRRARSLFGVVSIEHLEIDPELDAILSAGIPYDSAANWIDRMIDLVTRKSQ